MWLVKAVAGVFLSAYLGSGMAIAQSYPAKPVRIVVPFAPGGSNDILARLVGQKLTEAWGQQVLVDNRASAAGVIAGQMTASAAPDGYTLLLAYHQHTVNAALGQKLPYHPVNSFTPITHLTTAGFMLVVHPSLPVKSVKELVALAKSRPGQLSFASTGNGSTPHLSMEMFKAQAGINLVHIAYKGTPQAVIDIMSGQVQVMFANTLSVLPLIRNGRLRALGISGAKRTAAAPEIETVAEAGMKGFEASTWFGLFAPAGTPPAIVQRLSAEIVRIVQQPDMNERLLAQGADPIGMPAEEFRVYVKSELAKWSKVVRASGATVE